MLKTSTSLPLRIFAQESTSGKCSLRVLASKTKESTLCSSTFALQGQVDFLQACSGLPGSTLR